MAKPVMTKWTCPHCGEGLEVDAYELATIGVPHCPSCDQEIEMEPYESDEECSKSPTGKHESDGDFCRADGCNWIADVRCKYCGRSGSVVVDPREVQW